MASTTAPYIPQDPVEVTELINNLRSVSLGPKSTFSYSCKRSTFPIASSNNISVDSWKFQDWDYKRRDLHTYARGLFTCHEPNTNMDKIIIRGYDKFFNIDEVTRTKWSWIEGNTKGPYEVTVKENGCIIFISGLPDGDLLVCSKHSTGARGDVDLSHAVAGEKWVNKHLASVGKTRGDLARALSDANATAVAELCDDSFEEHVLAYEGDRAGLYLHGINLNLPEFATYPTTEVKAFADKWGFKVVDFFTKQDVGSLREFLEEAAEKGSWDGKDVEGFVIRCKARVGPQDDNWPDWFFKYKFDEPYLMYRQWRECTKQMIRGKAPRIKNHEKITKQYLSFAAEYFKKNPEAKKKYEENHGIISLRDAFLAHQGVKGSDIIREEAEGQKAERESITSNLCLVPIATIGCGKTTIAVALSKLFGWGHIQNDNITGKNRGVRFASAVSMEFIQKPVVIADRNNHQKRERDQLFVDVTGATPAARYVALHYVHDRPEMDPLELKRRIKVTTAGRVLNRGDNHQTINANKLPRKALDSIMQGFLDRFEPLDTQSPPDDGFDSYIDLDPEVESRTNLEIVVKFLKETYPKIVDKLPTSEEYDAAIQSAMKEYSVDRRPKQEAQKNQGKNKGNQQGSQKKKTKPIEYFSISLPAAQINSIVENAFVTQSDGGDGFYKSLCSKGRIQPTFHVTLIHRANSSTYPQVWQAYEKRLEGRSARGNMGVAKVTLEKIVWNGRLMAITVSIPDQSIETSNPVNHITLGTSSPAVKPKESNDMLKAWKNGDQMHVLTLPDGTVVEGVINATEMRH
ncbi:tRNA ligase [Morchella snyderi]|nr:tRNA ligase [Morchella snyderi]